MSVMNGVSVTDILANAAAESMKKNELLDDNNHKHSRDQETDNEALSSLLMLSKLNNDCSLKNNDSDNPNKKSKKEKNGSSYTPINAKTSASESDDDDDNIASEKNKSDTNFLNTKRPEVSHALSKTINIECLRKYFHLPIAEVAKQLGTCTTALKKICRKNNIIKWPYRQIRSITKSVQSLEMASLNDNLDENLRFQYREQIINLQNAIDKLLKDPNCLLHLDLNDIGSFAPSIQKYNRNLDANGNEVTASNHIDADRDPSKCSALLKMLPLPRPKPEVEEVLRASFAQSTSSEYQKVDLDIAINSSKRRKSEKLTESGNGSSTKGKYQSEKMQLEMKGDEKDSEDKERINSDAEMLHAIDGATNGMEGSESHQKSGTSHHKDVTPPSNEKTGKKEGRQSTDAAVSKLLSDVGESKVTSQINYEEGIIEYSGAVHLAPLQRKQLRPQITRKVVPLMEPDIGCNFQIEVIPQFVIKIVHSQLNIHNPSVLPMFTDPSLDKQQHESVKSYVNGSKPNAVNQMNLNDPRLNYDSLSGISPKNQPHGNANDVNSPRELKELLSVRETMETLSRMSNGLSHYGIEDYNRDGMLRNNNISNFSIISNAIQQSNALMRSSSLRMNSAMEPMYQQPSRHGNDSMVSFHDPNFINNYRHANNQILQSPSENNSNYSNELRYSTKEINGSSHNNRQMNHQINRNDAVGIGVEGMNTGMNVDKSMPMNQDNFMYYFSNNPPNGGENPTADHPSDYSDAYHVLLLNDENEEEFQNKNRTVDKQAHIEQNKFNDYSKDQNFIANLELFQNQYEK